MTDTNQPNYQRLRARYHWARQRGCTGGQSLRLAVNIDLFREFAISLGTNPDSLGDMAKRFGRVKGQLSQDPKCVAWRRRYRELRDLGATYEQADRGAPSDPAFMRVKRELTGVFRNGAQP